MPFVSSIIAPTERIVPAWWYIVKNDELLVTVDADGQAHLPQIPNLDHLHLTPVRTQYLGQLDGVPCYAAELAPSVPLPEGFSFQRLRPLFEMLPEEIFWVAARAVHLMYWDHTHQYCGQCGHPTEQMLEERAKRCPQCGFTSYPRISPAIIVAVVKGQELLLAHAKRFASDMYSVIAGFVEPGETFEECVRREVKEEVGIDVAEIQYFGSQPWPFPDSLMVAFTAQYAGGELQADGVEVTDAKWCTVENLPTIPGKISVARKLIDWFVAHHSVTI